MWKLVKTITSTWREIGTLAGIPISQDSRYTQKNKYAIIQTKKESTW